MSALVVFACKEVNLSETEVTLTHLANATVNLHAEQSDWKRTRGSVANPHPEVKRRMKIEFDKCSIVQCSGC